MLTISALRKEEGRPPAPPALTRIDHLDNFQWQDIFAIRTLEAP
jgi:hypothetical protein